MDDNVPREEWARPVGFGFSGRVNGDADGTWQVQGLLAGVEYKVAGYPPGERGGPVLREFTAKPGETVDLGEMVLKE